MLEHRINGTKIRPKPDPHPIVLNPWWPLTCVTSTTLTGAVEYTVADLRTAVSEQLGLSQTSPSYFTFKIKSARLWGSFNDKNAIAISVRFFDPRDSGVTLCEMDDAGTGTSRAAVGYVFPSHVANRPLLPGNANALVGKRTSGFADTILIMHFELEIQMGPAVP